MSLQEGSTPRARIQAEARAKMSAAKVGNQNAKKADEENNGGSIRPTVESVATKKQHKTRAAKASKTGVKSSAVKRAEKIASFNVCG